jgi:hypothetical protein
LVHEPNPRLNYQIEFQTIYELARVITTLSASYSYNLYCVLFIKIRVKKLRLRGS